MSAHEDARQSPASVLRSDAEPGDPRGPPAGALVESRQGEGGGFLVNEQDGGAGQVDAGPADVLGQPGLVHRVVDKVAGETAVPDFEEFGGGKAVGGGGCGIAHRLRFYRCACSASRAAIASRGTF